MRNTLLLACLLVAASVVAAEAKPLHAPLTGIAKAVDGDTLEIEGSRIRLFAVDAPEKTQPCFGVDGTELACGIAAAEYLRALLADGAITCEPRGADRFGRLVAVCFRDGQDIAKAIVRAGWAVAALSFSPAYAAEEELARKDGVGIWNGSFEDPASWRRRARSGPPSP